MRPRFAASSLRRRLTLIVAASSMGGVVAAASLFLATDYVRSRDQFLRQHSILAQVTAGNSRAALAFRDPAAARRVLEALRSEPSIRTAFLFTDEGDVLAGYPDAGARARVPEGLAAGGHLYDESSLHLRVPVSSSGREVGTLYVRASLADLRRHQVESWGGLAAAALAACLVAAAMALRMQRSVSGPILALAGAAERIRQDGSWSPPEPEIERRRDELGQLARSFRAMLDELRRRETALRESESNFRSLTEQASDGVLVLNAAGRISSLNPAARALLGYGRGEALDISLRDLVDPEDLAANPLRIERVSRSGSLVEERRLLRKDGSRIWVETNSKQLEDGRIQTVLRDLTDRMRLEAQFRQAQKLEAVGRLAGGIAHDFNNLLTVIVGVAESLLDSRDSADQDDLQEILAAAERAATLTRQLLAFSRQQRQRVEVVQVSDSLRELEGMLRRVIGEDVEFEVVCRDAGYVRADPGQLEQVVVNLVVNARDAVSTGGRIAVLAEDVAITESERPLDLPPGAYVKLTVEDDGGGIAPDDLPHIFEPFFTTKEAGRGTGLGLATVYGIVQQSGGYVDVESVPGVRTAFHVYLPRVEDAVAAERPAASEPPPLGRGETVLLVEDDPDVRHTARAMLHSLGYEVLVAEGAADALAIAAQHGRLDLLLTDLVMPGMNGAELSGRIRRIHPESATLLMSGYAGVVALDQPGLSRLPILAKPFGRQVLARRVREALGGLGEGRP